MTVFAEKFLHAIMKSAYRKNLVYGIIDDDRQFSSTLAGLLKLKNTTWEVHQFMSAEDALQSGILKELDFLFVDSRLDGMDGITFLGQRQVRELSIPKLIISGFNAEGRIFDAMKYGIAGYMFKEEMHLLNHILDTIFSGGAFLSPSIAFRVLEYFRRDRTLSALSLTDREEQILDRLCDGFSSEEISEQFSISRETVKVHIRRIYKKMEVNSYRQLVAKLDKG